MQKRAVQKKTQKLLQQGQRREGSKATRLRERLRDRLEHERRELWSRTLERRVDAWRAAREAQLQQQLRGAGRAGRAAGHVERVLAGAGDLGG